VVRQEHRRWPASGLRYLALFVIEYSLWITIAVRAGLGLEVPAGGRAGRAPTAGVADFTARRRAHRCSVAAFLVPFAYYTR